MKRLLTCVAILAIGCSGGSENEDPKDTHDTPGALDQIAYPDSEPGEDGIDDTGDSTEPETNGGDCVPTTSGRFRDNCDGSVTDTLTGNVWMRHLISTNASKEGQITCNSLVAGGFMGWRMPTIDQLRTLISGCDTTQTGGTCRVSDECFLGKDQSGTCFDASQCAPCANGDGPGVDGCYWDKVFGDDNCHLLVSKTPVVKGKEDPRSWYITFYNAQLDHIPNAFGQLTAGFARCILDPAAAVPVEPEE